MRTSLAWKPVTILEKETETGMRLSEVGLMTPLLMVTLGGLPGQPVSIAISAIRPISAMNAFPLLSCTVRFLIVHLLDLGSCAHSMQWLGGAQGVCREGNLWVAFC